jgi:hypothetical protein
MAVMRDLAPVAICAMYEYARGHFQSIQADGTEPVANTLKLDLPAMPEMML